MQNIKRTLRVNFFKTDAGNEPVRVWLKSLSSEEKKLLAKISKQYNLAGQSECH